ncbi:WD40 repeat-like protein, partial [Trametes sanguinea]
AVAVSPTGALIVAVFEEEWRLWDVSSGHWTRAMKHAGLYHHIITWSPSGKLFVCADRDNVVRVWEAQTGNLVESFVGHSDFVTSVVFTANEQHLLSESRDGTIRRWKTRQTAQETSGSSDPVRHLSFSPDGQGIIAGMLYVRISSRWQPLSKPIAHASLSPAYFLDNDGWLWRICRDSARRRLCWLPPQYRPADDYCVRSPPTCGHVMANMVEGRLMVLDAASC